jgi:16S rRNA C967 or C1407 C5-methylase (RsmB/RsmF family)
MNSPEELNFYFVINTKSEENYELLSQKFNNFLKNKKIPYKNDDNLEYIYQIPFSYKNDIVKSDFNKNGKIIILDKASIYTANLFRPIKDDIICDMCAGPGMKTSIINQFSQYNSHIVAAEFRINRTKTMKSLFNFYQMSDISIINTDSISFPLRKEYLFDKILLDAPCTGNGAFSSNPELKWRQNNSFLHQNIILQEKLLQSAINMLKQGGELIYSTCSFYPQEGELQILKFLDRLDPLPLPNYISFSYNINDEQIPGTGRLFPLIHGTKGFFIGKFKKKF